eukprot:CAMPEP_0114992596 /NCGR_PEP_ID=MMETSP0216-20121206/12031_1 /TAXON_ID=223996 /ORGANISM="Protocruzia adherens, Strain Boccale" /LENGTH=507 /DNA_ID=CAMNT_0002356083 /DNA_START=159 /DNA_END=1682 /DNA_ORIENTATION=+
MEELRNLGGKAEPIEGYKLKTAQRTYNGRTRIRALMESGAESIGKEVKVAGWTRTVRVQGGGSFCFVEISDGSTFSTLQCVVDGALENFEDLKRFGVGASVMFYGTVVESPAKGQAIELSVKIPEKHRVILFGGAEQKEYPLAKKRHTLEHLRSVAHLRPRTNAIGAVTRVRNALAFATHQYFQSRGFLYIHTPLITTSDCEGAGEMFQVTTVLPGTKEKTDKIQVTKEGRVDYHKDFFKTPSFLTVSGQLSVESYCNSMSDVYTFGPTFRAEDSHTSRHLAEFWMIEPELAFSDLYDDMTCAEEYLKYCIQYVMDNCADDLEFFNDRIEKGLIDRLKNILDNDFRRVSYTEAVDILKEDIASKKVKFEFPVDWGTDLSSEHERYLAEKKFGGPIVVYNYPKEIKSFYMRLNDDNKTVAAMDILVPRIGEVVGGSQREERLDVLDARITESGLEPESYWWYRDLRKYGTTPHAGFGLGFERLIMMITGIENIRDVIPFPRYPGHAEF